MNRERAIVRVRELIQLHGLTEAELFGLLPTREEDEPVLCGYLTRPVGEKLYPVAPIGAPVFSFRGLVFVNIDKGDGSTFRKQYYRLDMVKELPDEGLLNRLSNAYTTFCAMTLRERTDIVEAGYNNYALNFKNENEK